MSILAEAANKKNHAKKRAFARLFVVKLDSPRLIVCNNVSMSVLDDRISIDPNILNGKPSIRGKRIAVQTILEFLSNGDSIEDILANYPSLTRDDVYACLKFASNLMEHNYVVEPLSA